MYIGDRKIKGVLDNEDGTVKIGFKDGGVDVTLKKNLFEIIKSEDKRNGNITDMVNHVLATKFLMEMSEYGLEYYMAENIGVAMHTLVHNLREEKIGKVFDCSGANSILLSKLLE